MILNKLNFIFLKVLVNIAFVDLYGCLQNLHPPVQIRLSPFRKYRNYRAFKPFFNLSARTDSSGFLMILGHFRGLQSNNWGKIGVKNVR